MEPKKTDNKTKQTLIASGVALLTAASLVVGGLFQSPADLLRDEDQPIVAVCDEADPDLDGGDGDPGEPEEEKQRRGGARRTLRERVLAAPLALRLLVVLPLWLVGSALSLALGGLWTGLSPALGHVLGSLLLIAALFAAFLLGAKAIFPDLPIKKILNRRTVPRLLLLGTVLSVADRVLLLTVEGYASIRQLAVSLAFLAALAAAVLGFARRERRRRIQTAPAAPETEPGDLIVELPEGSFSLRRTS